MEVLEELVKALFEKSVKDNVSKMFKSNFVFNGLKDRMHLKIFDLGFRLFKPTQDYVNLEILTSSDFGRCFHPVALFDKDLNIYIFNEYIKTYQKLVSIGQIRENTRIIDKKTNAVVAAFSMNTIGYVLEIFQEFNKYGWETAFINGLAINPMNKYDRRFECNGFLCELIFSTQGYPQFYLDNKHNVSGAIGAYIQAPDGKLNIHPTVEYKELVEKLNRLQILTAFTKF